MDKRLSLVSIAFAIAGSMVGCDNPVAVDGGTCPVGMICLDDAGGGDAGVDAGRDGSVVIPACDFTVAGARLGSACRAGQCQDPFTCVEETPGGYAAVAAGTCGSAPNIMGTISPNGGECTELCDFNATDDPCGECGECSAVYLGPIGFAAGQDPATGEFLGACRPSCTPSLTDNGGCRVGYTCSTTTQLCVEACPNDEWCKYILDDCDGDGEAELVYQGAAYPAQCNLDTGRCELMGDNTNMIGGACEQAVDCPDNGFCLSGDAFPDGYCTRFGCNSPGFECGTGAVCDVRNFGDGASGCLDACSVGMDTTPVGAGGQGSGCAPGFSCAWDGVSTGTTDNGGCLPGEFNDIAVPNVGSACQTSADCWSPYGYGDCWFANGQTDPDTAASEVNSGICVVNNCLDDMAGVLPGAGMIDVCDETAGEGCFWVGGAMESPLTACLQTCTTASICPTGYGCRDFGDVNFCWPFCEADAECRTGQTCRDIAGTACDPTTEDCFCTPTCTTDTECAEVPGRHECVAGRCRACDSATDEGCTSPQQCVGDACVACDPADDGGCTAPQQCNPATTMCVACLADGAGTAMDSGCDTTLPQCDATTNTCTACDPVNDAGCMLPTGQCNPADRTCVACLARADCTDTALPACDPATNTCVACLVDTDCTDTLFPTCETTTHLCVPLP